MDKIELISNINELEIKINERYDELFEIECDVHLFDQDFNVYECEKGKRLFSEIQKFK